MFYLSSPSPTRSHTKLYFCRLVLTAIQLYLRSLCSLSLTWCHKNVQIQGHHFIDAYFKLRAFTVLTTAHCHLRPVGQRGRQVISADVWSPQRRLSSSTGRGWKRPDLTIGLINNSLTSVSACGFLYADTLTILCTCGFQRNYSFKKEIRLMCKCKNFSTSVENWCLQYWK